MPDIRKLKITKVTAGYTGVNRNGNEYTIYDVEAEGVELALRSFDKLPIGENEYEVETYAKNGRTNYTLKPHGFRVARDTGGVSSSDLDALDARVTKLEAIVGGSEATPPAGQDDWPAGAATPAQDDIPFAFDFSDADRQHCWNHFA